MARSAERSRDRHIMTVRDNLRELLFRLMAVLAVFLVAAVASYSYRQPIIELLLSPLHGRKLIYLNPGGGFSFILLISVYVGLAAAVPLAIQQLYSYVKPMVPTKVRHHAPLLFVAVLLLLIAGIAFGYVFAIPGALNFLYGFAGDYIQASLTADSYLNFVLTYTIGMGLVFQVPLLLILINTIKPLSPKTIFKSERWVIVLAFVAAAIITPTPDPWNQTIIAMPIVIVYQIGVITVLISNARHRKVNKRSKAKMRPIAQPRVSQRPVSRPRIAPSPQIMPKRVLKPAPVHAAQVRPEVVVSPRPRPISRPLPRLQRPPQSLSRPLPQLQRLSIAQPRSLLSMDGIIKVPKLR